MQKFTFYMYFDLLSDLLLNKRKKRKPRPEGRGFNN